MSLKKKTINGFKWSFLNNVGKFGGQFFIGIVLTRLLSPNDFGLVGMLAIFIVIGQSLINSGFGQALIQKKNADKTDFSTVFYFNILASILIYILFTLCAPLIASFYDEPQLTILTRVICLTFVINAFGLIHIVDLEKKLEFKAPSIIGVVSVFAAGVISIFLAIYGFGVWALVANTVLRSLFSTILFWRMNKWRPLLKFNFYSLKGLFSYGSKILVAGLVESFFKNVYYIVIGKFFPTQTLGYFTRATQFKDAPIYMIQGAVQKVTFPVFSTIQDDNQRLILAYRKVLRHLLAITLPLMAIIYMTCKPLISIVLGAKWLPVVPYLQLMSVYAWLYIICTINLQIINIKGRSDYYLKIQIIDKVFIVVSILLTFRFGIIAMIYGHMVSTVLSYLVGSYHLNKLINDITLKLQLKNMAPFFIAALLMFASSLPLSKAISSEIKYLFSSVILGTSVYLFFLWIFNVEELKQGLKLVSGFLNSISVKIKNGNS